MIDRPSTWPSTRSTPPAASTAGRSCCRWPTKAPTQETAAKGLDELLTKDRGRRHRRAGVVEGGAGADGQDRRRRRWSRAHRRRRRRRCRTTPTTATSSARSPSDTLAGQGARRGDRRDRPPLDGHHHLRRRVRPRPVAKQLAHHTAGRGHRPSAATTSYDATATDFSDVVDSARWPIDPASVAVIGLPDPGGKIIADLRGGGHLAEADLRHRRHAPAPTCSTRCSRATRRAWPASRARRRRPTRSRAGSTTPSTPTPRDAQSLYAAYAYDCTNLIALAAQTARHRRPDDVRERDGAHQPQRGELPQLHGLRAGRGRRSQHRPQRGVGAHRAARERRRQLRHLRRLRVRRRRQGPPSRPRSTAVRAAETRTHVACGERQSIGGRGAPRGA